MKGLVIDDKAVRVANFQRTTVHAFLELLSAAGLDELNLLRPWHIVRRTSATESKHYGEIYDYVKPGSLLSEHPPKSFLRAWLAAQAASFDSATSDPPNIHAQ